MRDLWGLGARHARRGAKWYNRRDGPDKKETSVHSKDDIRREMRARRKALTREERERASEAICGKLASVIEAPEPSGGLGTIAVYLASPDEIDLADFIREALGRGVAVASPRWNGVTYEMARIRSLSEEHLRRGPMGILEPAEGEIVEPGRIGTWIIPGLAFTREGVRLGYGGGWYDRLLAASSAGTIKIGVAHDFQLVDDIPSEPHDIRLDRVVTDAPARQAG